MEGVMVSFDMRTIIVSFLLTYIVCSIVIFILWVQYHKRYQGTMHLLISFLAQTSGLLLIILRGAVPEWVSVDLANTLIIAGFIICYMGLEAYSGLRTTKIPNYVLLSAFAIIHTWFTVIDPNLTARNLNISAASLLIFMQSSWLMLYRVPRKDISLTHPVGIVFVAFSLVSVVNILLFILGVKVMPVDYFDAGRIDSIMVIIYHMLVILLTFSLILMFSKNLILDIKSEEEKSILTSFDKISEQNRYNEILSQERQLLRTLIDNLPDPVSVKDREGHFLIINNAYLEVLGADNQEEVIGKSPDDFLPVKNAGSSEEDEKEIFLSGKKMIDKVETFTSLETGFSNIYLTSKIPIFDNRGIAVQLVTISHDITARKRAEDGLRESAEFNRLLIKTIPFGMDIVDEEGIILFQSDNFRDLAGFELKGNKCWEVYREDRKQCNDCPLTKGIEIGKTEKFEAHGVLGNRVFNIYHTGMYFHGKKAMLEIFHDITDQKHSEYKLIRSKEKAEDSDRLKTAFLHNISHEIRTPLNAIVGFTALLSQPDITPENHQSYLNIITESSDHLLAIVTDIIEISNIEAGKAKLNLGEFNVDSVLENLYRRFGPIAESKDLEFKYEQLGSGKTDIILTDRTKLNQILTNLIENALKFTEEGFIRFGYSKKDGTIEFLVSDTGPGIPSEFHEKIFDRFYQIDSSENRKYEGTGIGLSISKSYVGILGGKIWVISEPGKGSNFFVSLPC